jgi:hypothetical protein
MPWRRATDDPGEAPCRSSIGSPTRPPRGTPPRCSRHPRRYELATLAAAQALRSSYALDALDVQADAAYAGIEPRLRDVLTIGRPIADA